MFNGNAQGGSRQDGLDRVFNQGQIIEADGLFERAAAHGNMPNDERAESQGFDTVEAQNEMGGGWSNITVDALYLAADIAMIVEPDGVPRARMHGVEPGEEGGIAREDRGRGRQCGNVSEGACRRRSGDVY